MVGVMLDKSTVIRHIQQINRSALPEWLECFDLSELRLYLDHLQQSAEPRGGASFWQRRADSAAVVTRGPVH